MSFFDFIKSLSISFNPTLTFNRRNGNDATLSKIKAKKNVGDVAGRDIIKNYTTANPVTEEPPYVYLQGGFGGNGVLLRLVACSTHNLSDQFIFLERIDVLGRTIPFNDHVVKAGEAVHHTGIDALSYPDSDEDRFLEIFFKAKNGKRFVARQKLQYQPRQDGKFNVIGLAKADIESVK